VAGFLLGKYLGRSDMESLRIAHTLAMEILQVEGANVPHLDRQALLDRVSRYYPEHAASH
jgi:hypothetical protein